MTDSSAVTAWRRRRERQGFVRLEVQVRKEDVELVRAVASALGDAERREATRAVIREHVAPARRRGLKALLAEAPLDGIDLERPREVGREIDV